MSAYHADRLILRELAKRQAEVAELPVMAERIKLWHDLNDGKTTHPLVVAEFHGLEEEIYPPLACEEPFARTLERQIGRLIFKHENFQDDRVIPASVSVIIPNAITPFDFHAEAIHALNPDGTKGMGHQFLHAIHDLQEDFHFFKPSAFDVDAGLAQSYALKERAEEILGDILPVRLEFPAFVFCPANILIKMMSMETMFYTLYDYPDLFHKVMRQLTDDYHAYMSLIESSGALLPNNDASRVPMDSYGYTHDLPNQDELDGPVRFNHVWGYGNFQETVGMSVAMFDEFFFSYTQEIADRCGLFAYGCCEPVHTLWEPCLSRLTNLRKVSVSPWCNEEALGEMIRGKKIVYHRKPSPNYISVDGTFDDEAFLKHMERTVTAARGCPLEVTFRDVTSVRGELWRLPRSVELMREAFARWWRAS